MPEPTALSTSLAGVTLRNPVIAAAGTCGYVRELASVLDPVHLGAITMKSITRAPRDGNPPWRIVDTAHGMLNAIGLANVGLDQAREEVFPDAERVDTIVIGSIAGDCVEDYVAVAEVMDDIEALPLVELNVSCPNTEDGLQFGATPDGLCRLLDAVRPVLAQTKLIVKLSPNAGDMVTMARAAIEGGADVLTLINTMPALALDVETRQPRLSRGTGGLSGPAIHPIAVRMVREVYEGAAADARVPIIGLGGVMNWRDAAEFILAGATAVGMGTALFVDPRRPIGVTRGLERWVRRQHATNVVELVGQALL